MTRAIWACAIILFLLLVVQWGNYTLNYDYLYDNIPTCVPEPEGIVS